MIVAALAGGAGIAMMLPSFPEFHRQLVLALLLWWMIVQTAIGTWMIIWSEWHRPLS